MKRFTIFAAALIAAFISMAGCQEKPAAVIPSLPTGTDNDLARHLKAVPFSMSNIARPKFDNYKQSITDFGGVGDGITDNTKAFAKAMKSISQMGGGRLIVPKGVWYTGPITFENDVNLHLQDGAVILFSSNFDDYPIVDCYFEGLKTKRCMSPLNANGKKNIGITGFGTIDGNGNAWRWVKRSKVTDAQWKELCNSGGVTGIAQNSEVWAPTQPIFDALKKANMNVISCETDKEWEKYRDFLRPTLLDFNHCTNVLLEGVCFQNSPAWNLHPFMCENVIVNDITVINPWYSQNGDGIDIEACKNVLVANSRFDVGDDAICVKSGKNKDGRDLQTPCENIVINRCAVYHGHGGFVVGSEMSSGVKNVSVSNCMFLGTDVGLRFKSARGRGGVVENIHISNINMIDIPTDCILFDLHYSGMSASEEKALGMKKEVSAEDIPEVTEETPQFKDIYIKDIVCRGANRAMYFNGIPEMPISNINIKNCNITAESGLKLQHSTDINIKGLTLSLPKGENEITTYNVHNLVVNGDSIQ
ncbi:MAG: glycoside hydrolase family 28 protein [Bacteroidales bacterium]|nr:glycoside hydrolase family 28 protein [Bacteroidales bacterium]